ncbi:MAG: GNAT family N-acetyltransferase [Rhodospirillaceae bacterium]
MTGIKADDVILRGPHPGDLDALWTLCRELGYETTVTSLEKRLNDIVFDGNQAAYVAEIDGMGVIGYVHVFTRHSLEVDPCAQIQALVVADRARRHGVAAKLMAAAEAWARGKGLTWLSLYCTTSRDAAHAFYPTQGFEPAVTATRFNKTLD